MRPLLFVNYLFFLITILFILAVDAKHGLFLTKDNIVVICTMHEFVTLLVSLLVDQTDTCVAKRVIAEDLVLDLLRLEAEQGFYGEHRVIHLQLDKLADNHSNNNSELVVANT